MSYSTDPVLDAARYYDAQYARDERQQAAEIETVNQFLAACRKADANAIVDWAPTVTDFDALRAAGAPFTDCNHFKRRVTLAEVMNDSLDMSSGPDVSELHNLLLAMAYGTDLTGTQERARNLVGRMAVTWAQHFTPEVD